MYLETKKINVIAEVLKVEDESTLDNIESVLKEKKTKKKLPQRNLKTFSGIISDEDAEMMTKVIKETSGTVHPDDWK